MTEVAIVLAEVEEADFLVLFFLGFPEDFLFLV